MVDGQTLTHPALVDPFPEALGDALAAVGATRGSGPSVKSTARLLRGAADAEEPAAPIGTVVAVAVALAIHNLHSPQSCLADHQWVHHLSTVEVVAQGPPE